MTYDAVVFDNDGVLVGPTEWDVLQAAAWDAFEEVGVDPTPDHVEAVAGGADPDEVADVCATFDLDPETFWRVRDRVASEAQQREMRAGRKTLYHDVDTIRDLDVPLGIVSSNQQETIDFQLDHFGVADLFDTVYGREPTIGSLHRKKPEPHYLERALADLDADSALYVGDNESDVTAAVNAGVDSAFIRRPHRRDWHLSVEPTHELQDLHDLHAIATGVT